MKIVRVEVREHRIALREAYAISGASFDSAELVELRLIGERGELGLGCAAPAPEVTGETKAQSAEALRGPLQERVLGRTLEELGPLMRQFALDAPALPAARAALDIALHDLLAKERGVALVDLLGRVHVALPTSVTIGVLPLAETLDAAARHIARGFRALKLKIGRDLELDIERLTKLRECHGRDLRLRTDPNAGYSLSDLKRFAEATQRLELELCEQPLARGCEDELRDLAPQLRAQLAADESLHDERDVEALLHQPRPYGIWNLKLMKAGGIAPARELARRAMHADIALMWGCNDESVVSIAAALAVALASPSTRYLDLDGSFDLSNDFASGGFTVRDGCLHPLPLPGLGVELCT